MRCPYGSWPVPEHGCPREGTVRLKGVPPDRRLVPPSSPYEVAPLTMAADPPRGMAVDACDEHAPLYRAAGWVDR